MSEAVVLPPSPRPAGWPALLLGTLLLAGALLCGLRLAAILPPEQWWQALTQPVPGDMTQVVFRHAVLPRMAMALLCGAALALSGVILQRVLRNPIASPLTLGISPGAQLALGAAMLWAPTLLAASREAVALAGATTAMALVAALSWKRGLAPAAVVLAGLVVGLTASALSAALILMKGEYLLSLLLWGAGSLAQAGWEPVLALAPRLALAAAAAFLLRRPLLLLGLEDTSARSLGLSLALGRAAALGVAVWLAAVVVAEVGVIGFVGIGAPALARLAGVRGMGRLMAWSAGFGAALLLLADGLVQLGQGLRGDLLPTGAATAVLGAPILLWLLPRLRAGSPAVMAGITASRRLARPWLFLALLLAAMPVLTWFGLALGRGPEGWSLALGVDWLGMLPWRAPRLAAAMAAGAMLAASGTVLQRLTGNPMAGPEVLGLGAGAGFGLALLLLLVPAPGRPAQLLAVAAGAGLALGLLLLAARRGGLAPERLLLAGVSLAAFFQALVAAFQASGDPRAVPLLGWLAGSTARLGPEDATIAVGLALLLLPPVFLAGRWLALLPLGDGVAVGLGLRPGLARLGLVLPAAMLAGAATLVVGPLSFVGLMAPHLARWLGLRTPRQHLAGAVLLGALVMGAADVLGRGLAFPFQLPAGLVAALLGGPYLMALLARRGQVA
ncbi:Fe(3+)-hydroxamate ABC transporter permease FhuB [Roseicella aerolata]|uniref:Fe(3+)-hydroxamate ABC transporter permease FhuB n=1 Tax=Roseicella aerolata TaxID=2883479 RepID=A0A9X1IJH5_9PROT|nr:Fe(3+)-hydroxamate ABC transporter permease FhuB [Roseicella aerolata]MCB4825286.1 Fe(3+)-hydroxamate ABC transporter permease FhuB [Roseicella aerolata]